MSTKIYYGRRLAKEHIIPFLDEINSKVLKIAQNHIKELKKIFTQEKCEKLWTKVYEDFYGQQDKCPKYFQETVILSLAFMASQGVRKNPFCLDFSINLWPYRDYFYMIPYGEQFYLNKLRYNKEFSEAYFYFDNSDKPKRISNKQWKERSENWSNCCLDNWHANRLCHEIINIKEFNCPEKLFSPCFVLEEDAKKITEILFPKSFSNGSF